MDHKKSIPFVFIPQSKVTHSQWMKILQKVSFKNTLDLSRFLLGALGFNQRQDKIRLEIHSIFAAKF